jgi:hypothetical protein
LSPPKVHITLMCDRTGCTFPSTGKLSLLVDARIAHGREYRVLNHASLNEFLPRVSYRCFDCGL